MHNDAREELVASQQGMLSILAKHFSKTGLPYEDLRAEGSASLAKTLITFDENKGIKFGTFAIFNMKNAMCDYVRNNSRMIGTTQAAKEIPVRALTDIDLELLCSDFTMDSLVNKLANKEILKLVLPELIPRQKLVIYLYYYKEWNLKKIAKAMGIGITRVSQIRNDALLKMRKKGEELDKGM